MLASAADQVTVAIAAPGTAVTLVGASAGPAGITVVVGADANEVPMLLVAFTVKVYEAPFTKPVTTQVVVFVMHDDVPALGITLYSMIAEPLLGDAVHDTVADWLPRVAVTFVGTPGKVAGMTSAEAIDAADVPTEFTAFTVNV